MKNHPTYTGNLSHKLAEKYNLEIIDPEKDASEIILYLRPSYTVGWMSTALCESLRYGVIPISFDSEEEGRTLDDLLTFNIYPIKKRSLSWEEEKEKVIDLLEDTSLYAKTLAELRMK